MDDILSNRTFNCPEQQVSPATLPGLIENLSMQATDIPDICFQKSVELGISCGKCIWRLVGQPKINTKFGMTKSSARHYCTNTTTSVVISTGRYTVYPGILGWNSRPRARHGPVL